MASLKPECAGPPLPVKILYQICHCCFIFHVSKSTVSGDLGALHHIKCSLQEYLESLPDDRWTSGSRQYICSCLHVLQSQEMHDIPVSLRIARTVTTHSQGLCGLKQLTAGKTAAVGEKTPQWFLSFETYFLKVNISPQVLWCLYSRKPVYTDWNTLPVQAPFWDALAHFMHSCSPPLTPTTSELAVPLTITAQKSKLSLSDCLGEDTQKRKEENWPYFVLDMRTYPLA